MVTFTKWATYSKRRQCEAVIGTYPDDHRVIIRAVPGTAKLYDVTTPSHSSATVHGPTIRVGGEYLGCDLPLREAKRIAAEYLQRLIQDC